MESYNFFVNKAGRLRSGWRLAIFVVAFAIAGTFIELAAKVAIRLVLRDAAEGFLVSNAGYFVQGLVFFTSAAIVGWACGRLLEGLPFRALGWANHRGWLRDFGLGSIIGGVSLVLAVLVGLIGGGYHFSLNTAVTPYVIGKALLFSGVLFIVAAAGEEMLFRGYPLQTLTRARLVWLAIFLTSVPFAAGHLWNPNVVPGVTFANTALAGVWLAIAYLRTRSLWLPLGIHWAWNWTMGSVFGLPVSGITRLGPAPLFRFQDTGPAWLTGGAYGPEGGAIFTVAILVSMVFLWRSKWLRTSDEMKAFTSPDPNEVENGSSDRNDGPDLPALS